MKPATFRKSMGWTQGQMASRLGLRSKARISALESGADEWPAELAIRLDRLSRGVVPVAELRPDLHDVRVIHGEVSA